MRKIIIPVLVLGLIVTGAFAYNQKQKNHDLKRRTEAQYQKNFHELVWGVDMINSQLAQTLVTSTPEQIMHNLTNLWRECFGAEANLSAIPVVMIEIDKTQKLLDDIANYSYYLLKENNINQKELTKKEWDQIQELYERSIVVSNDLSQMEASLLENKMSFLDLEMKSKKKGEVLTNHAIVSGFTNIENKVSAFPEIKFEEGIEKLERLPQPIKGKEITSEEAIQRASEFLKKLGGIEPQLELAFEANGRIPVYGLSSSSGGGQRPTYLEITKKGGHLIQLYIDRNVKNTNLEIKEAEKKARDFLEKLDLVDLELVDIDIGLHTAVFTFVPTEKGVLLYSDMLKVLVALDNGKILNFDQTSYLAYHYQRVIEKPFFQAEEITAKLNPNFKVLETRLALVADDFEEKEILTYEIRGQINEEKFLLFIDAGTGEDVRVVRLTKPREYDRL